MQGHLQLVCNFLIWLWPLESSIFVVHFSNAFWYGKEAFPKGSSCCSPCSLPFVIQLIQGYENIFSLVSLSKLKFLTRVAVVSFVQRGCRICVALMLHSCCLCLTRVALVSFVLHLCRTRVGRVWHSCCKKDQILNNTSLECLQSQTL